MCVWICTWICIWMYTWSCIWSCICICKQICIQIWYTNLYTDPYTVCTQSFRPHVHLRKIDHFDQMQTYSKHLRNVHKYMLLLIFPRVGPRNCQKRNLQENTSKSGVKSISYRVLFVNFLTIENFTISKFVYGYVYVHVHIHVISHVHMHVHMRVH